MEFEKSAFNSNDFISNFLKTHIKGPLLYSKKIFIKEKVISISSQNLNGIIITLFYLFHENCNEICPSVHMYVRKYVRMYLKTFSGLNTSPTLTKFYMDKLKYHTNSV